MSIRNNEERFGAKYKNIDPPPPQIENQTTENEEEREETPPLSFSLPTEFVDLPSKGIYYQEDHPLHQQDTMEIRYMTARDEDILTSRSLLQKGVAIDRFLQNIIVNKHIKIDSLLTGDKNALVVAARITGYGPEYKTKISCPSCGEQSDYSFDLGELPHSEDDFPEGVEKTSHGTFIVTAPKTNVKVELKLLKSADEKTILRTIKNKKKKNIPESPLTDQLRMAIVSINGRGEPNLINLFVNSLPAFDARYLRDVYGKLMPNIDMKQNFMCPSCGAEQELEVPLTSDFFWPK